jgi:hypothetical protein
MFSTRSSKGIRFTAAGLSYLDRTSSQKDILTIQAFRWQYPNGHNTQKTSGDSSSMDFSKQQMATGVLIRPAVLIWQVLNALRQMGQRARLSASEIENFLMPVRTHQDTYIAVAAIVNHRATAGRLPRNGARRRNALDWIIRLSRTHAFLANEDRSLSLSRYSGEKAEELSVAMDELIQGDHWWLPPSGGSVAESWYQWYGTQDAARYPVPRREPSGSNLIENEEPNDDDGDATGMSLQEYRHIESGAGSGRRTVTSTYSADISESAHRLHDTMVRLIAERCLKNGAQVFFDPNSVDLLVKHSESELLLEVKSATSANFVRKIRTALGQVAHYDFLRSKQTHAPRRKALAVTIDIPEQHWSKEFISDYLDMDLVALRSGSLLVYSRSPAVNDLLSGNG